MSIFLPRGIGRSLKRAPQDTALRQYRHTIVASSGFIAVTTPGTAYATSAWVQAVGSLAGNCGLIFFNFGNFNSISVDSSLMVDIATGAAGSETVIVPTVAIGGTGQNAAYIPVSIPSGSRVSIRVRSARTSVTYFPFMWFIQTGDYATTPRTLDVIGVDTGTAKGTAMTGASGSYTQITASTSRDYQQVVVVASSSTASGASGNVTYTLAYGAAGSEVDQGSIWAAYSNNAISPSTTFPFALASGAPVPAGTRLSVKHNIASNPERYAVCLLGIPYV